MPDNPNKLSQFWQELKRRNVTRVLAVYIAAAFMLLELITMISEPFGLPEGTLMVAFFISLAGLVIAVIVSWVYDIHPEAGLVKTEPPNEVKAEDLPVTSNSWKIASYISFVVIIGLILLNIIPRANNNKEILEKSIAVLPFDDMSPEKDQEYFCDGMAVEIINALTHIEGLKVIARTSAFAIKGKHEDMREIGNRLDVATLLVGSVRKDGNQVRITVQLIKAEDGSHIWSKAFNHELEGVFTIQEEISLAIADNLKVKLLGEEKAVIVKRPTENLEAYNLYLKGGYYHAMLTPEGLHKAMKFYEQALQKDPNFALAYLGMASAHRHLPFIGGGTPSEAFPRAIEYANKALEIDNAIALAYIILGDISMYYDWDWEASERYYKKALQLNPHNADALSNYSNLLTHTGRNDKAIDVALLAQELDPLSSWANHILGYAYFNDHQFDKAIEGVQMTLAIDPNYLASHFLLGEIYLEKSVYEEAIATYEKAVELSGGNPIYMALLANTYYEFGEKSKAEELFEIVKQKSRDGYVSPTALYLIHKAQGEEDLAYECAERAYKERDFYLIIGIISPIEGYGLPDEPRYNALLKKLGLEKYQQ